MSEVIFPTAMMNHHGLGDGAAVRIDTLNGKTFEGVVESSTVVNNLPYSVHLALTEDVLGRPARKTGRRVTVFVGAIVAVIQ